MKTIAMAFAHAWANMKLRSSPEEELEKLAGGVFILIVVFALVILVDSIAPKVRAIAACPIHVVTSHDDYCLTIGLGR